MPRWKFSSDRGSAALEFVTAGLILLVPLVYLVLALAAIQAGAMAVEGAARQAARVFVQAESTTDARAAATTAVAFALADQGVDPTTATVTVTCTPAPNACLTRSGLVTIAVEVAVPLPLAPAALSGSFPLAVPLRATATQKVSRFWGAL